MPVLNPAHYTVAWIAPLEIEARAALLLLDNKHLGGFPLSRGDDYIFLPGDVCGHNIIIATLPAGQEYGTGSAAAIASQVKKCFPNLWFGLLVGVAAGLPNFSRIPPLDIRLGDVLVGLPEGDSPALVAYDLGKETDQNGFQLLHGGHVLSSTEAVVRSAIGRIKLEAPNDATLFLHYYEKIKDEEHCDGSFVDPGQENDLYYDVGNDGVERPRQRQPRPASKRTRVWYGPLGSGDKLMKNARKRNELRDRYNIIGLEMEAAGTMNRIAVGVIRGVCDYGDEHKNKQWQPYAAAMAAAYAKAVLTQITPARAVQNVEAETQLHNALSQTNLPKRPLEENYATEGTFRSTRSRVAGPGLQASHISTADADIGKLTKEEEESLIRSLAFDQIDDRHNTIENALADTCQWLLETSSFRDWLDPGKLDKHHGFLWIKGKPGAGKSTLMKFALQDSQRAKGNNIIFFFFNARGDDLEKSTAGMYRSLLLQLFERLPKLRHVLNSFRHTIKTGSIPRWTTQHLKSLFSQAVHDLGESSLMLFIDALDECDEDQIRDMVAFLQDIAGKARQKNCILQICFASRHYPQITIEKVISLDIVSQEGHNQDIMAFVKRNLQIGYDQNAREVHTRLIEKASGVFMWVVLVVRILQKVFDKGHKHELKDRLKKTPEDLNALFYDILTRDGDRQNEFLWCIQWILFAKHPLSPGQLREAVLCGASSAQARDWRREKIEESEIEHFIIDRSKGLAEITKSKNRPTVQFIHESVRDFLLEQGRLQSLWPDVPEILNGESHERLKQCCLSYCHMSLGDLSLQSFAVQVSASKVKRPSREATQSGVLPRSNNQKRLRRLALTGFPFLEYAVRNVLRHADAAEGAGVDQSQFLASFPLSDWIKLFNATELYLTRHQSGNASLLYILSEYNAANLIKCYPGNLSGFKKEDGQYGLPIVAALAKRSHQAVLTMMEAHAENEPQKPILGDICKQYACSGHDESRPVHGHGWRFSKRESVFYNLVKAGDECIVDFVLASTQCDITMEGGKLLDGTFHTAMARVLLKHGSTLPLPHKDIAKLKVLAASHGFLEILQALIDRDRTMETLGLGTTPLVAAAKAGHTDVVAWLLRRNAIMEAKNPDGTLLTQTLYFGSEATVQLLLENGARVENATIFGNPALCYVTMQGNETAVRLLIDNGADIEAAPRKGCTPLRLAVSYFREAIARMLIDNGANIEAADDLGQTPLSAAARDGNEPSARLLIDKGANIEAADHQGRTPLSWAASSGSEVVVQLFTDNGADVNSTDTLGRKPLFWAMSCGYYKLFQLLKHAGADSNTYDDAGRTLMNSAVARDVKDSWALSIDLSANINRVDARGNTQLHWASIDPDGARTIPLLVGKGANTEQVDVKGQTALIFSIRHHVVVCNLHALIGNGANIEAADPNGYRPLHWAVELGYDLLIRELIMKGADLGAADYRGNTPLSIGCSLHPNLVEGWLHMSRIFRERCEYSHETTCVVQKRHAP